MSDGRRVVGEWVYGAGVARARADAAVYFIHGSGYALCSPRTHRRLTAWLSRSDRTSRFQRRLPTGSPIPIPHCRRRCACRMGLADRRPRPRAGEDSIRRRLCRRTPRRRPAAATRRRAPGRGGADVAPGGPDIRPGPFPGTATPRSGDPGPGRRPPHRAVLRWNRSRTPAADARRRGRTSAATDAHPCRRGRDCWRPTPTALADAVRTAGGSCELQVWPDQVHVFQALPRLTPEAAPAMRRIADFIAQSLRANTIDQAAG